MGGVSQRTNSSYAFRNQASNNDNVSFVILTKKVSYTYVNKNVFFLSQNTR